MATEDHPSPGIKEIAWIHQGSTAISRSIFSYVEQVYDFGGRMRSVEITLAAMGVEKAKEWRAFFLRMNGPIGTFYLSDSPAFRFPQGVATGSPVVDSGNTALSSTLLTTGWDIDIPFLVKAGDEFSIDDRLYTVLADTSSDGSGDATLTIWPPLPATLPADSTSLDFRDDARGIFRMEEIPAWVNNLGAYQEELTFIAHEALADLS